MGKISIYNQSDVYVTNCLVFQAIHLNPLKLCAVFECSRKILYFSVCSLISFRLRKKKKKSGFENKVFEKKVRNSWE